MPWRGNGRWKVLNQLLMLSQPTFARARNRAVQKSIVFAFPKAWLVMKIASVSIVKICPSASEWFNKNTFIPFGHVALFALETEGNLHLKHWIKTSLFHFHHLFFRHVVFVFTDCLIRRIICTWSCLDVLKQKHRDRIHFTKFITTFSYIFFWLSGHGKRLPFFMFV